MAIWREVLARLDHPDVWGPGGLFPLDAFRRTGTGYLARCPNPAHPDRHPSFSMPKGRAFGHCFACGYRRGWIGFVMEQQGAGPEARGEPFWAALRVLAQLDALKARFAESTRAFVEEYPALQTAMTPTWREIAKKTWEKAGQPELLDLYEARFLDAIAAAYAPASRLERRFSFSWTCYTIQVAHWEAADAYALAQEETQRRALEADYRAQAEARIGAFVDEVVDTLRAETAALCQRVIAHIQSGKAVTERTLKSLGAFVGRFKALNFVGDQAIEAQLEALRAELLTRHSAAEFRDDAALTGLLTQKLQEVAAQAESISDRVALTGEYRRRIRRLPMEPSLPVPEEASA